VVVVDYYKGVSSMDTLARQELAQSLGDGLRAADTGKVFQGEMSGSNN